MDAAQIVLAIVSIIIIIETLIQSGKSEGASGAITGGSQMNIFARTKERGADKIISIITMVTAIVYFFVAILANYL